MHNGYAIFLRAHQLGQWNRRHATEHFHRARFATWLRMASADAKVGKPPSLDLAAPQAQVAA